MIAKTDLQRGAYYYGRCRNAAVARWDGERFWYRRFKLGGYQTDSVEHPDDYRGTDVFTPELRLDHLPKEVIPIDMPEVP